MNNINQIINLNLINYNINFNNQHYSKNDYKFNYLISISSYL